jgi:hypothetical protein
MPKKAKKKAKAKRVSRTWCASCKQRRSEKEGLMIPEPFLGSKIPTDDDGVVCVWCCAECAEFWAEEFYWRVKGLPFDKKARPIPKSLAGFERPKITA